MESGWRVAVVCPLPHSGFSVEMTDDIFTLFTLIKELLLSRDLKIPVNTYIQVETIHTARLVLIILVLKPSITCSLRVLTALC